MIPVTVLTGFLGAGKTSLLNHMLLTADGLRLAVIVNDFGAVNIDEKLIVAAEDGLYGLENGCVCCSLSEGLLTTIARILRRPDPPEHIVIETSGVSDPYEVARVIADPELQRFAPLDSIVAVVDAEAAAVGWPADTAALARRQVAVADLVLLNKVDLVDADRLQAARAAVRAVSPAARLLETTGGQAPLDILLGCGGARPVASGFVAVNDLPMPQFESFVLEDAEPVAMRALHATLAALPPAVLRVKGMVYLAERPLERCILQFTGQRAQLTAGAAWGETPPLTQLVFIASAGQLDRDQIRRRLLGR